MRNSSTLTEEVKREARSLGFDLVGVTSPDPPPHWPVFKAWLAAGRQGEMAYLANERSLERRSDPRRILPECLSILALGLRYPVPSKDEADGVNKASGRVASYAWGANYHIIIPPRLQALVRFIEAQAGRPIPNRWYTDTGPVLERDLAQRAGLGWIGKNTCLIHPRLGSYFLLAEVLLGIDLEVDAPFEADRCGTCTRCLKACPTQCILPDRTIDAARCISYLTIELKGAIQPELRPQVGNWVFGCDICQQVCPWNQRFAKPGGDPAFAPRSGIPNPDLVEELSLSAAEFNQKFIGSPVKRTKRRGYFRNVAVALGNHLAGGDRSVIPALIESLLHNPEALVRGHAAWALSQAGGADVSEALIEAESVESDENVLAEIRQASARYL